MSDWSKFFRDNAPPENYEATTEALRSFCRRFSGRNIVLVTSGKLTTNMAFFVLTSDFSESESGTVNITRCIPFPDSATADGRVPASKLLLLKNRFSAGKKKVNKYQNVTPDFRSVSFHFFCLYFG
jgi:hypothetical protein